MDLISRKSVAEKMARRRDYVGRPSDPDCIIADEPSVPAVPLDKLCLLLHDIAVSPCYTQPGEDMCNQLIGDQCNTEWDDVECWKQFLTKWMEGLDAEVH